jgi:hypothetical protein
MKIMEHQPHHESALPADETAVAERERQIAEGLELAWRTGRRVDDLTAKRIARTLDPGDGPLHEFAETGAIPAGIEGDLATAAEVVQDIGLGTHLPRIAALGDYLTGRLIKTEMPYWNEPGME